MESKFKNTSGIYKITNNIDSRCYIGSAVDLYQRYHGHKKSLSDNNHRNNRLQNFVNKYGFDKLSFSIVEICSIDVMIAREQYWIDLINPTLNIAKIAGSSLGIKRSEETKSRIGLASKNRLKVRNVWKGRKHSEETKLKLSIAKTGKKQSAETIAKKVLYATGRPSGMLGKQHSLEAKLKMSATRTGMKNNEETKRRKSLAQMGNTKGTKITELGRLKISILTKYRNMAKSKMVGVQDMTQDYYKK